MKVALVHDYIKEYGGAERVLEVLHEIWPDAPVFTLVYLPEFLGPHQKRFASWDIRTSFLQHIPLKAKLISPFRLIVPFVFKTFDLSKYDIVIVSATGAYTPNNVNCHPEHKRRISLQSFGDSSVASLPQNDNKRGSIHICYCHTPPRYLYGYATARDWKKNIVFRAIGEIANHFLRLIDFKSSQNVDYFIANSRNVAGRIKKFYRKDSKVIYPPVDMDGRGLTFHHLSSKDYYLAGGRLARPKHIDLIVKACQELKVSLKVFGRGFGGYGKELGIRNQESGGNVIHNSSFMIHNSNIEFIGEVTDEEKLELMRNAKAFIFAAEDEDFGITPVEAMSVGTPVIAFASGGVTETIVDRKTGILYHFNDIYHLSEAIHKFNMTKFDKKFIIGSAQKFAKERFKKEIKEFVNRHC